MSDIDFGSLDLNGLTTKDKTKTKRRAEEKTGKVVNLLMEEFANLTGGNSEKTNDLMTGLALFIKTNGFATLLQVLQGQNGATIQQPVTQQPIPTLGTAPQGLTGGTPTVPADKVVAVELGERILALTGNNDALKAAALVQYLEDALKVNLHLLDYMGDVAAALRVNSSTNRPDDELIELPGRGWVLKSQETLRRQKDQLDTAFDTLVEEITGSLIANHSTQEELDRAKTELSKVKNGTGTASTDTITKLLNELGTKLDLSRNAGEGDADYQKRLVDRAAWHFQDWNKTWNAVSKAAKAKPFGYDDAKLKSKTSVDVLTELLKLIDDDNVKIGRLLGKNGVVITDDQARESFAGQMVNNLVDRHNDQHHESRFNRSGAIAK